MKLLVTGDWHLTTRTPRNRIDDYPQSQRKKIAFIFSLAVEENVKAILQPGDAVDHSLHRYNTPDSLKREYILFFKEKRIPIITIPGQHDMRYHSSDVSNTPLGVFESAANVTVITNEFPEVLLGGVNKEVMIYGAGWNKEVPKIQKKLKGVNILLTHRMIIKNKKVWGGQKEYDKADALLRKHEFDLIVSGDNHQAFIQRDGKKWLVNCGSLMRSKIDQVNHKPVVYIYDTEKLSLTPHLIPIEPFEDVMNIEEAVKEKEKSATLDLLIEGLSSVEDMEGIDFKEGINAEIKVNREVITEGTIGILNEVFE